jgi:hypothetical protein
LVTTAKSTRPNLTHRIRHPPTVRPLGDEGLLAASPRSPDDAGHMRGTFGRRLAVSASAAMLAGVIVAVPALADHGGPHVELQSSTQGCTGVLPSNDGNTNMRVVGGSMTPGGTAVFEISYPVTPANVGKEFTILDCAYINDVATLKYIISFVPSNEFFVLRITLAVPTDAPVGGLYCNYVKTTGSPTAAQASQRKAGPACFVIRPPFAPAPPPAPGQPSQPSQPSRPGEPPDSPGGSGTTGGPILLPDTAMPRPGSAAP